VRKLADVGLVTQLFLLKDLILLPTLLLQNLVGNWLQGGLEPAVLLLVGAVVVALV
jgi:hypothetical protein